MISQGKYRHFKGGIYRVLVVVPWNSLGLGTKPKEGDEIILFGGDDDEGRVQACLWTPRRPPATLFTRNFFRATWAGAKQPGEDELVVLYSNTDGIWARTEAEFEEFVEGAGQPRFVEVPG